MNTTRLYRYLISLVVFSLIFIAIYSSGTLSTLAAKTSTPTGATVPVPPTQTSCPAAGTARAAVMTPLALGHHQNVVYIVNESASGGTGQPTFGTLKRYDVTTSHKTEIIKMAHVSISEAQISADGQWLLFVTITTTQPKLQLIRMDGQELQTLYCAKSANFPGLYDVQWASDLKLAVFKSQGGLYLLNLKSGKLQLEFKDVDSGPPFHSLIGVNPLTWLDTARLYVIPTDSLLPTDTTTLDVLDTRRGPNQQKSDLKMVFQWKPITPSSSFPCWNADSSYDGSTLFTSECNGLVTPNCSLGGCTLGTREGPSDISVEAATGGKAHTIFTSSKLGIASVRSISSRTLLLLVENFSRNHTVDKSQNGLWKINTDGSGLKRLTSENAGQGSTLNQYNQYPWSNVSRDGKLYVLQTTNQSFPTTYTLLFGSLSGGTPTIFASISGTQLAIVGWTTM